MHSKLLHCFKRFLPNFTRIQDTHPSHHIPVHLMQVAAVVITPLSSTNDPVITTGFIMNTHTARNRHVADQNYTRFVSLSSTSCITSSSFKIINKYVMLYLLFTQCRAQTFSIFTCCALSKVSDIVLLFSFILTLVIAHVIIFINTIIIIIIISKGLFFKAGKGE